MTLCRGDDTVDIVTPLAIEWFEYGMLDSGGVAGCACSPFACNADAVFISTATVSGATCGWIWAYVSEPLVYKSA